MTNILIPIFMGHFNTILTYADTGKNKEKAFLSSKSLELMLYTPRGFGLIHLNKFDLAKFVGETDTETFNSIVHHYNKVRIYAPNFHYINSFVGKTLFKLDRQKSDFTHIVARPIFQQVRKGKLETKVEVRFSRGNRKWVANYPIRIGTENSFAQFFIVSRSGKRHNPIKLRHLKDFLTKLVSQPVQQSQQ